DVLADPLVRTSIVSWTATGVGPPFRDPAPVHVPIPPHATAVRLPVVVGFAGGLSAVQVIAEAMLGGQGFGRLRAPPVALLRRPRTPFRGVVPELDVTLGRRSRSRAIGTALVARTVVLGGAWALRGRFVEVRHDRAVTLSNEEPTTSGGAGDDEATPAAKTARVLLRELAPDQCGSARRKKRFSLYGTSLPGVVNEMPPPRS